MAEDEDEETVYWPTKHPKWTAPFTPEQVEALKEYQKGLGHPYTCGIGGGAHGSLIPTEAGWHCEWKGSRKLPMEKRYCDYTQNWAHAMPITLRHTLMAASLPVLHYIAGDGYGSMAMRSDREAADIAMLKFAEWLRSPEAYDAVAEDNIGPLEASMACEALAAKIDAARIGGGGKWW